MTLDRFLFSVSRKVRKMLCQLLTLAFFCSTQQVIAMNSDLLLERQNSDSTISSSRPNTAESKDRGFQIGWQTTYINNGGLKIPVRGLDFEYFCNALIDFINSQENMARLKFWHNDDCIAWVRYNNKKSNININLSYTDDGIVTASMKTSELINAYPCIIYNERVKFNTPLFDESLQEFMQTFGYLSPTRIFDNKKKYVVIKILRGKLDQIDQSDDFNYFKNDIEFRTLVVENKSTKPNKNFIYRGKNDIPLLDMNKNLITYNITSHSTPLVTINESDENNDEQNFNEKKGHDVMNEWDFKF